MFLVIHEIIYNTLLSSYFQIARYLFTRESVAMGKQPVLPTGKKMIKKACPECKLQVAVACKNCKCGHSFFHARARRNSQKKDEEGDGQKRRTGRVRREKPQFYDPSKFENKRKKRKDRKNNTKFSIESNGKGPKGTRLRGPRRKTKKDEEERGDAISQLSEEKQKIASIILAEINQKLGSVVWNPK